MITLEDQIRRYATDVAGPAVAEAPADLLAVGRPHHRGRWVLVAALVVFIAGLTWVATRPAELSDQPTVDTVPTATIPSNVVARPSSERACDDGSPTGVALTGSAGTGLCMAAQWMETPPELAPTEPLVAMVYLDGAPLGAASLEPCGPIPSGGAVEPGWVSGSDLLVIFAQVPVETATARVLGGDDSTLVAFDLPGVEGSRFVLSRGLDPSWTGRLELFDSGGRAIDTQPPRGDLCSGTPVTRNSAN